MTRLNPRANFFDRIFGGKVKNGLKPPADLDSEARKKWRELILAVDPTVDAELLSLYCQTHSNLTALRREKAKLQAAGSFRTMVPGREGSEQLNPMLREENRLTTSLARMLRSLGLAPTREDQERTKKKMRLSNPPPPGFSGPEPPHGWAIEVALCGRLERTPEQIEAERRCKANQELLARDDWRAYESDFDPGRAAQKD